MPDTFTTNFNLTRPEPNGSRDTWGSKTNGNWTIIDNALKSLNDKVASAVTTTQLNDGLAKKSDTNHTHAQYLTAVPVYAGSSSGNTTFPVGSTIIAASTNTGLARNAAATVYLGSGSSGYALENQNAGTLGGTWRNRGRFTADGGVASYLMERTA